MNEIEVLDQQTIDKIAAGEVVERPSSIVKELVENSIDAGATAVTVEITDGGKKLIRITDNGGGMDKSQVPLAFLRHATSKIRKVEDLQHIVSLGFRGEALSSIAAVAQVEMITKTPVALSGVRYVINGGVEESLEDMGAPDGTTFLVRNLFYNTPARSKFLKSDATEGNYISTLMEQLALSHPEISFKYIQNKQVKLHTSGNYSVKDVIYNIYGKEITRSLIQVSYKNDFMSMEGFVGKPEISRGNRSFENYCINGRYVKNSIISRGIEDAYKGFLMQHKFPFVVLHIQMEGNDLDVNVHPSKMEVRFARGMEVYDAVYQTVHQALTTREMIPDVPFGKEEKQEHEKPVSPVVRPEDIPEPFEKTRRAPFTREEENLFTGTLSQREEKERKDQKEQVKEEHEEYKMLLSPASRSRHKLIGQLFDTYWLVQFEDRFFIIDQHAAHEKIYYERFVKAFREQTIQSQYLSPPLVVSLNLQEEQLLKANEQYFRDFGFEIEPFGGKEYCISAVPINLYGLTEEGVFLEMLDQLSTDQDKDPMGVFASRLATMACKAAVKGNHQMSVEEADSLIDELLTLDNPYHCPHGRPVIISMTKTELEKKFKRIV